MDTKPESKTAYGCFAVLVILVLATSFLTTGSWNPLTVYISGGLWVRAIVTILAVLLLPFVLRALFALREAIVWLILIVLFGLGTSALFDNPAQDGRVKAAYAILDQMKLPNPENEDAWGLSEFQLMADARGFLINSPEKTGTEVVIPIWIRGKQSDGHTGKWKTKMHVTVKPGTSGLPGGFEGTEVSLDPMKPLSWWEQLGRWLVWSLLAPVAIFSLVYGTNGFALLNLDSGCVHNGVFVLAVLGSLALVGYFAYAYFGSILAVIFGLLFGILLTIITMGISSNR